MTASRMVAAVTSLGQRCISRVGVVSDAGSRNRPVVVAVLLDVNSPTHVFRVVDDAVRAFDLFSGTVVTRATDDPRLLRTDIPRHFAEHDRLARSVGHVAEVQVASRKNDAIDTSAAGSFRCRNTGALSILTFRPFPC